MDQINLTDEDSRIMPVAGGGFEQCYNAQAVVATESLLVIATDVVQAPNDKQQIAPMLSGNLPPAVIRNRSDDFQQLNRSIRSRIAGT
jgi:hypothetical protein